MDIRLQKRLKKEELYFVVFNPEKKVYNDWFIFDKYKKLPNLEKYFFEIMTNQLNESFEAKEYSSNKYKALLLILYNICLDGNKINIRTSNLISNLFINIRYRDLANSIDVFRNKFELSSIENYKEELLKIQITSLSGETKKLFDAFKTKIGKNKDESIIFKELLYLCILPEYDKAICKANKMKQLAEEVKEFVENEINIQ